jgi:hypothetical protein
MIYMPGVVVVGFNLVCSCTPCDSVYKTGFTNELDSNK